MLALLAGCATTDFPEIPRTLRDREPTPAVDVGPVQALPGGKDLQFETVTVQGSEMACTAQRFALERLVIAAKANTESLGEMIAAYRETNREAAALLYAGQAREEQADRLRALYLEEANRARWIQIGSAGAGGVLLLLFGAAAL
jgi:hypothetical protein